MIRNSMILKNDLYLWKIDYDSIRSDFPFVLSEEADFINIFLTFDMSNRILKDLEIVYLKMINSKILEC